MIDYIGGDIVCVTGTRSGHRIVLQRSCRENITASLQQLQVRGPSPGEPGDRLVVMLLEDEVAGWHNQTTGEQRHLLNALPLLRWRLRDAEIAAAATAVLYLASKPLLGLAGGLGWLVSMALWRLGAMRDARKELVTALQLAAGVSARQKRQRLIGQ